MNILAELFYGNIRPCDNPQSAETRQKQKAMFAAIENLKASLPDEKLKEQVDDAFNLQTELISLSDRDSFIDGFSLGVLIASKAIHKYNDFMVCS